MHFSHRINADVELRIYMPHDADVVFRAVVENREHLSRYLPWADATKTVDDTREFIRRSLEQLSRNEALHAGIWERGQFVGGVGFHKIVHAHDYAEIGYWLSKSAEGRGLMTAACRAIIDYAFDVLKMNKVEIRAVSENERSRAVAKRLGFVEEGIIRQHSKRGNEYLDMVVYGALASEWKAI